MEVERLPEPKGWPGPGKSWEILPAAAKLLQGSG
jgi:hypothetical protein